MKALITIFVTLFLSFSIFAANTNSSSQANVTQEIGQLKVYKNPQCGCCSKWIEHMQQHNVESQVFDYKYLSGYKAKLGIRPNYQSCHTAVTKSGYVFEGHVPFKFIEKFMKNPPKNALGLSVPAMPLGAPGMEMGDKFLPYKILLLNKDGSATLYATINNAKEQY